MNVITLLKNQLRLAWFKRTDAWQKYPEAQSNAKLQDAINVAKTAHTIMMDRISEWAGNLNEADLTAALPKIWRGFVQMVQNPEAVPAEEDPESTEVEVDQTEDGLALEDMEPIQVINRPTIPEDAPKSKVAPPEQVSLGDVLGLIEKKNAQDD